MKKQSVLLVFDDVQTLETMGTILEMEYYKVASAFSGHRALEILAKTDDSENRIDFLVVDLDMKNISGLELITIMRRYGYFQPVLVVSGFASKTTLVELMRRGVSDFLNKPIQMEEFKYRIKQISESASRCELPSLTKGDQNGMSNGTK